MGARERVLKLHAADTFIDHFQAHATAASIPQFHSNQIQSDIDDFIENIRLAITINGTARIAIYGAGSIGRRLVDRLAKLQIEVVALVDRDPFFKNREYNNIPIYSPNDIAKIECESWIVASISGFESINNFLENTFRKVNSLNSNIVISYPNRTQRP